MFKERKSDSLESKLLKVIAENTSQFGHKFMDPNSKAFHCLEPRDHQDREDVHEKLANHHHNAAEDYRAEMGIKARRGDHAGMHEAWQNFSDNHVESMKHRHQAMLHNINKQIKSGISSPDLMF
jgi:hypothetical protein